MPTRAKETRFFDTHFERGISWYQAHYRNWDGNRPMGEIAPTYFASATARERIAELNPQAKVICIFRNPVERILSLYRLKRAYGMIRWNLEEAIVRDPELMQSSKYATNLREWQKKLGADHVLATFYDDLRENPQSYIDVFADFIGIPRFALSRRDIRHVHASKSMTHPRNYYWTRSATTIADWCKAWRLHTIVAQVKKSPLLGLFLGGGREFSDLSQELSRSIYERCRSEIEDLEVLLKRDLSAWKYSDGLNMLEVDGPGIIARS